VRVYLDPGHGGEDPGAVYGGVKESDLVLSYALTIRAMLEERGHAVDMSRTRDTRVSLVQRAIHANEARATVFVSVHANASTNTLAQGFQAFHAHFSTPAASLAQAILEAARPVTGSTRWTGVFPDTAPQTRGPLYVLRATAMPAVLVELGFLSCPEERDDLLEPAYRGALCAAIVDGLEAWGEPKPRVRTYPEPVVELADTRPAPEAEPVTRDVRPLLQRDAAEVAEEQGIQPTPGEPARRWLCRVLAFLGDHPDVPIRARVPARVCRSLLNC
jgi:hypothetical protein